MTTYALGDLVEAVIDAVPDREALVVGGVGVDTRRFTYVELEERSNRVATGMAGRGIGAGDHVGIALYNSHEFVECMIGLFKLGAVPVNVNYRYGAEELRYLFADADLRAVVVEPEHVGTVEAIRADVSTLDLVVVRGDDYESLLAGGSTDRPPNPGRTSDDLYLLYTGGTTGMPKGVMWRHEDIVYASLGGAGSPRFDIDRLDSPADIAAWATKGSAIGRRLPLCPMMHGGAQWLALQALLNGGTIVLDASRHYDPEFALQLLSDERVNMAFVIGDAVTRPLVDALVGNPGRWNLSSLRVVGSGGAILSPAVKDELARLLPTVRITDTFGASESGGQGRLVPGDPGGPPRLRTDADSCVFDDDDRPVEPGSGVIGRLARRGHIPLGYYKDTEKTAATFPTIDGQRWSIPGDMAQVLDDGTILLLGRGAVTINTGGEKVFPEEVEKVVKSHPAVMDAVVVGLPDERFGQRVTAVLSLRAGAERPGEDQLSVYCHDRISGYKVPRTWVFCDEVERLPTGKPDYRWAGDMAEAATDA